MRKLYLLLIVSAWITLSSNTAWSETRVYKLSVTLPQTITMAPEQNKLTAVQKLGMKASQMVLEQNVQRNHRTILVRSIVAR